MIQSHIVKEVETLYRFKQSLIGAYNTWIFDGGMYRQIFHAHKVPRKYWKIYVNVASWTFCNDQVILEL